MVNRLVIEAWRHPVKSSQSLNWEYLSWFMSELISLCFFLRAFFFLLFCDLDHCFSSWELSEAHFLFSWEMDAKFLTEFIWNHREIKVLILTIGALHLWGFYFRAEWRIGEVWGSKICIYPTLSVSVLLCGDNLQFLPCMFPISPFILIRVSNHNFSMLFFSLL